MRALKTGSRVARIDVAALAACPGWHFFPVLGFRSWVEETGDGCQAKKGRGVFGRDWDGWFERWWKKKFELGWWRVLDGGLIEEEEISGSLIGRLMIFLWAERGGKKKGRMAKPNLKNSMLEVS